MAIQFACGQCGRHYKTDDRWAGKKVRCPACNTTTRVPVAAPASAAPAEWPAPPLTVEAQLPHVSTHPAGTVNMAPAGPPPPPLPPSLCPCCAAFMAVGAVFCIACGYDQRTGRHVAAGRPLAPSGSPATGGGVLHPVAFIGIIAAAAVVAILVLGLIIRAALEPVHHQSANWSRPAIVSSPPPLAAAPAPVFSDLPLPLGGPSTAQFNVYAVRIGGDGPGLPMGLRIYVPTGESRPHSRPCVFIAPAGTRLYYGSTFENGDFPEHEPYARAGFVVVAYELSGDIPNRHDRLTYGQIARPARQFIAARGGVANAQTAIEYALQKLPVVDPGRLYTAGHSSAANVALDVAATDSRIRGVCAYAPAADVEKRLGRSMSALQRAVPGMGDFIASVSPMRLIDMLNCPIFLFHADDDGNILLADNQAFADALKGAGKQVDFVRVPTGGHYQSMLDEGVPAGIKWLIAHGAAPPPSGGR